MRRFSCLFLALLAAVVAGQSPCPSGLSMLPGGWVPTGFCASAWATGLSSPRGVVTAANGDLLVVEASKNRISALWDGNNDGVNSASERAVIATASGINHGIRISGQYLYASSGTTLYRWKYIAGQRSNLGTAQVVVTNIPCCHHTTRTPVFHPANELLLFLSVGSASNVDSDSSHAQIRRFNLTGTLPVDWSTGYVYADGLRNEVGLTFDSSGRLWGVENGCDDLSRADLGGDIHTNNPSEEVNLFAEPGKFYGYPYCWSEYQLPAGIGGGPGTQWLHPQFNGDGRHTDAWCKSPANVVKPAWNMGAHQAPLDIMFYYGKSFPQSYVGGAFVSLHGSWDRNPPQGYRVLYLEFQNGAVSGEDVLLRYNGTAQNWPTNIRPVALSLGPCRDGSADQRECLFVTSDASGHVIKIGYKQ